MALSDNVKISLQIEVAKSSKDVDKLEESLISLKKALADTTAGTKEYNDIQSAITTGTKAFQKELLNSALSAAENAKSVQELNKAMKALKTAQEGVSASSPDFKVLANAINKTEGRMGDLTDSFKTFTGSGVERLKSSFGLMSEGMMKADFTKAKIGLQGIGQAMKAIPIMLVISGLMLLIENFDKLKNVIPGLGLITKAIEVVTKSLKEFSDWLGLTNFKIEDQANKSIAAAKKTEEATVNRYDREIKIAESAGKKTYELEKQKQQAVIDSAKIQLKAIMSVANANKKYSDEQIEEIHKLQKVLADAKTEIIVQDNKKQKEIDDNAKKAADKRKTDREKEKADQLKASQEIRELEIQAIDNDQKREKEKAKSDAKKRDEDIKATKATDVQKATLAKANKTALDKQLLDIDKKYEADRLKVEKDEQDKIAQILQDGEDKQIEIRKKAFDKSSKLIKSQEAAGLAEINKERTKQNKNESLLNKKEFDLKKKSLDEEKKLRIANAKDTGEALEEINYDINTRILQADTDYSNQKIKIAEQEKAQKVAAANSYIDFISQISDFLLSSDKANAKTNFDIHKALNMAKAIINTATGVSAALASQNYVGAGIIGVEGGIQVATIAAQEYKETPSSSTAATQPRSTLTPSTGGGGSIGGGGTGIEFKKTVDLGNTSLKKIGANLPTMSNKGNNSKDEPIRAYVVSQDISDSQDKAAVLKRKTTF